MTKLIQKTLFGCCALLLAMFAIEPAIALKANAQGGGTLKGIVKDETGPLVGATVVIVGTSRGTSTDVNGAFYLEDLQNGNVLQVSYIGYNPVEITYQGQTNEEILLKANANELDAVVVTALGIERQSKTLTYAAQTVGGEDVADIKSINMINSLQGKSAGLQITPNSTGAGGSSKILFRGNKSINGSNQPLIVVDGVPLMMNITAHQELENCCLEREQHRIKRDIDKRWAELVYDAQWFSPATQSLNAFIEDTQKYVSGEIRMVLHGGRAVVTGRRSDSSLYDYNLATYDSGDSFDQKSSNGFIDIYGLPSRVAAARDVKFGNGIEVPENSVE